MKFTKPNLRNLITKFVKETDISTPCFNKTNDSGEMNNKSYTPGNYRERKEIQNAIDKAPSCRGEDSNKDLGNAPYAFDIQSATNSNTNYRTALWTGKHLQLTVMSIPVGEDTGIEMHENLDQFIRIESGSGRVEMGRLKSNMNYKIPLDSRYAILIPAGTYHNIINTGKTPLKLYSIYTPKAHPFGTVDITKADSEKRENS